VAYYFSNRMARLIILLGPVASALGGAAIGVAFDQLILRVIQRAAGKAVGLAPPPVVAAEEEETAETLAAKVRRRKEGGKHKAESAALSHAKALVGIAKQGVDKVRDTIAPFGACSPRTRTPGTPSLPPPVAPSSGSRALTPPLSHSSLPLTFSPPSSQVYNHPISLALRLALGLLLAYASVPTALDFYDYSHKLAEGLSQPQIMFKAKLYNGQEVMVDDYRQAYWWLRDHTPEDARVMAWWDYGYQVGARGLAHFATSLPGRASPTPCGAVSRPIPLCRSPSQPVLPTLTPFQFTSQPPPYSRSDHRHRRAHHDR
jgi:dolichyl-diphosphooligosaccharide--protein glycosyltransferase